MGLKKYSDYLLEASLKGNSGVPDDFLRDTEREAGQMTSRFKRERPRDLQNFFGYINRAIRLQSGHEEELEVIAEECIRQFYGSILDGVTLNIKFPKGREIQNMMEEPEVDVPDRFKKIEDSNTIKEIEKRKILKNITQGEAKNSKLMLNLPEVRDKITELMGENNGNEYLDLLNKITDIASFFDWDIPMNIQKDMWERNKDGFSGSVDVEWEQSEENDEDIAQKIIDSLKDSSEIPKEAGEIFNNTTPTINAFGKDFAMLLHETIKGIYQLIISLSIPEDPELAETVIMNTDTLADELEDLRYGPKFAANLRDFINEFPEADQIENLREHVVGKLSMLPAEEFLSLMVMFLNKDPMAKSKFQKIINEVKKDFSDYEIDSRNHAREQDIEPNEYDINPPNNRNEASGETGQQPSDEELKSMSDKEIMDLMDIAIDNADRKEYERLAKYLKESRNYEFD